MLLLLLFLRVGRSVLLECGIRDLKTRQGAEADVQDSQEGETGDEAHVDAYVRLVPT